jgi:hypothetical protein
MSLRYLLSGQGASCFFPGGEEVASNPQDPSHYDFLVGTKHIDDEDGLVYQTTRVVVRKGFIVDFRRLVTSAGVQPREESTPIHVADVARMTAVLHAPPIDEVLRVHPLHQTTLRMSGSRTFLSINPDRRAEAPLNVPSPSSSFHPGWNSQGRIATDTPADKRRRLSQGLGLRVRDTSTTAGPSQA